MCVGTLKECMEGSMTREQAHAHLLGGEGGGSNPAKLSRFSGTYSWAVGSEQACQMTPPAGGSHAAACAIRHGAANHLPAEAAAGRLLHGQGVLSTAMQAPPPAPPARC